ncbi:PREDICTED: nucleolar protein 9 [Nicrophorus vespilloides]|uniref:Nucleolar protein 9 n=1 Tax=Nicrophorus vespilloides TaxID=110193 RepID=A0ABM1N1N0_NICVS|nr:PREDICTED: nucleolar protein 9 [Nicrophorus vespilloides]
MSEETGERQAPRNNKRKRPKSFFQKAKKFQKQGRFGMGYRLDEDTYAYFVRILETYKAGFETDEDKNVFVNNVFMEMDGNEIDYSSNQIGCRVIETLMPFASDEILQKFLTAFGESLRGLCSDRFASHIVEALLMESTKRSFSDKDGETYKKFSIKYSKFLLNNLEDYIKDTYGNHTLRAVLYALSGVPKTGEATEEEIELPEEYTAILNDFGGRLVLWPHLKDLAYEELPSGLLQVMLKVQSKVNPKLARRYVKRFIEESFVAEQVFVSKPCTMLLEATLQYSTEEEYGELHKKCFENKIAELALNRNTNYSVQRLLEFAKGKEVLEGIFVELDEKFKEILEAGHPAVLQALGKACKNLGAKQGPYMNAMMKAFDCHEPNERQSKFVMCMSRFKKYDDVVADAGNDLEKEILNIHGTVILQHMLEFNKPIKLVNALFAMDATELQGLFSNSKGSHIIDTYFKSKWIGEKNKEKLIQKMQGCYQQLASSKYGSRSFDALWEAASDKWKTTIMNELSSKDAAWSNSQFGKIIAFKVNLLLYKRNREEWKINCGKPAKTKKDLVKDVLES